jgi:hypothetical protein
LQLLEALREVKERGVTLEPAGDRLRFRPKRNMTPELVEALREHKAEILRAYGELDEPRVGSVGEVFALAAEHSPLPAEDREPPALRSPQGRDPMTHYGTAKARFYREVRREDDERRRRGELPPWIRIVDGGAA